MKKTRKAFTLVELLVVIAILAVLATVGIVGYTSFTKKAKESNDRTVIAQINLALQASETTDGKPATMHDALQVVAAAGFEVSKLTPDTDGYDYVWDSTNNRFALMNGDVAVASATDRAFVDGVTAWELVDSLSNLSNKRSNYLKGSNLTGDVTVTTGFDAGNNAALNSITYNGSAAGQKVVIRTKGDQCTLNINAAKDDVDFYGYAKEINVLAIKSTSLHIYGSAYTLAVTSGHVEIENTGIVFDVVQVGSASEGTGASITNNGYIASASLKSHTSEEAKSSATAQVSGTTIGGDYEIGSLAKLEAFRDAVNSGNDFYGLTAKLTADITLNDGWKPIGEGNRAVAANNTSAAGTYFRGTFDGNNKTISNLNNKGFTPTTSRYDSDKGYAYGLFALVGDGAVIKNLTLNNVNIDTTIYEEKGDSVAALVGYAEGSVTVTGITVNGSVKAFDAVAGVIGRIYIPKGVSGTKKVYTVSVTNCVNNASAVDTDSASGKASGIIAMVGDQSSGFNELHITVTGCSNTGSITTHNTRALDGNAALVAYLTISSNNGRASSYVHD